MSFAYLLQFGVTRMDLHQLCCSIKERVASDLQGAAHPHQKTEVLISALYEVDRVVFPQLGPPKKSEEYSLKQAQIADLIAFLALAMIRGESKDCRGVAVLSEVAEGCQDPVLKKKLTIYAQELLAKPEVKAGKSKSIDWPRVFFIAGILTLGFVVVYSARHLFSAALQLDSGAEPVVVVAGTPLSSSAAAKAHAPVAVAQPTEAAPPRERTADEGKAPERGTGEGKSASFYVGEAVTRVRVVNNQVLVPVTLRNGGEAVRVELVLDTGSTRTSVHEELAGRLRIDLKGTRTSQSELADGRIVSSRIARIESLAVGSQVMTAADVELIPYRGGDRSHDGLLGMDFLAKRRYQLDMEHELIRWF